MIFQFTDIMDFFTMSGHGRYVWSSYLITLLSLGLLLVIPRWQKKQLWVQLKRQRRLEEQYLEEQGLEQQLQSKENNSKSL